MVFEENIRLPGRTSWKKILEFIGGKAASLLCTLRVAEKAGNPFKGVLEAEEPTEEPRTEETQQQK